MKLKLIFAWYDLWVGFYWDRKSRFLYFFPFPMFGIRIFLPNRHLPEPENIFEEWDMYEN